MESTINWSSFTVRINVNASVEKLYNAWSTRSGIENWFLRMSEYAGPGGAIRQVDEQVQPGDRYRWRWFGYPDSVTEEGEILALNGVDSFKFSFGKAGNCTVVIKKEAGETIVKMVQDNIPTDEKGKHSFHLGCKIGWTFYFANLKSLMEGGIDLRNKNELLKEVINS